jgi:hypothetical protein
MGKGHYHGGGTLVGFGTTTGRSKGGGRGLNLSSSPAEKQKVRLAQKKRKKVVAEQIAANEMLVKQLSDQWLAEKGQLHYKRLVSDAREKVSPLAAALRAAMKSKEEANE